MHLYHKFIGTLKKIAVRTLLVLISVQVAVYIALQFPATQTFIIQKIVNAASANINGKINIGKVYIVFFNKIILKDISIVSDDKSPLLDSLKRNFNQSDTLLSCKKLSVSIHTANLLKMQINLKSVNIESGVFNLQNEGGVGNTNLSRIFRINKDRPKDTVSKGFPVNLLANTLKIKNFRFSLNNPDKYADKGDSIINFSNLNISNINVNINNVRVERDTLFGIIKNISGRDISGYKIAGLSGNLEISAKEAKIKNMRLADNYSTVNARYFYMQYNSSKDLGDFVKLVKLGIDLNKTFFSFKTIGRIAPKMANSTLGIFISGEINGTINDLRSKMLEVTSESGKTFLQLKCKLTGLPDIYQTMSVVDIFKCYTTTSDISNIIASVNGTTTSPFLKKLSPHIRYNFKGTLAGLPHDFVAHGRISSDIGSANLDILLKNDTKRNGFLIQGNVGSRNFNIGRLISNNILGEVSMNAALSVLVNKERGQEISIDSIRVAKLGFNGYDYSNIYAIGKYDNSKFDGRIICHDPNLDFIFQGLFSFNKNKTNKYNYYADIPYANLSALNIDKRDSISIVKARTIANYTSDSNGNIVGNINILNTTYTNSNGNFNIGAIKLASQAADSNYTAVLTAPFVNASYNATIPFTDFINKIIALTAYNYADNLFANKNEKAEEKSEKYRYLLKQHDSCELKITTFNTNSICELLFPGSYIQDSTTIITNIDKANNFKLQLLSGRIASKQNYLKGLKLDINNRDSLLSINLLNDNIRIAGMRLDSSALHIKGRDNFLDAVFGFKNDSTENNYAFLDAGIRFLKDTVKIGISNKSFITLKGGKWGFSPSEIELSDSSIVVNGFELRNDNQYFTVNGLLSSNKRDSLAVSLNNFDIKIFNLFLNKPFNVEGYFSGRAYLSTYSGLTNIFLDLNGDSVYVYNTPVGVMKIMSKWYNPQERFNLLLSTKLNGKSNLMVTGYYKPQNNYLSLNGSLDELSVAYFEPFLSSVISKTNGTFSGNLRLHGPINKLSLEGDSCMFNNFEFIVNYTRVPYTLNGNVSLNESGIEAKELIVTDSYGNSGRVTGGLKYHYFKNPRIDARIDFGNLQCLQTRESDNEAFYGNAFATGSFGIKGPFDNLQLNINVTPNRNTALHIPLSSSATASQTNLLTFKDSRNSTYIDPYDTLMLANKKIKTESRMQVKLRANMNTNADMFIEINKSLGDVIKANGSGLVNLDIAPYKDVFDIFGDYNINQGNYKFVLSGFGFAAKDFIIQPGGTIHFNGAIENTTINLTAIYKVKTAINTLIADTSAVSTRRTVNCEIGMSGNLMNPELKFNIDIPDLDPTTKVRVESALNTEGKIQKQFAALLISGGFLPDEQSGITNNSTILYSNVSEMLSNQINNIFQQLGIPLDLGFNYQPGEKGTTDIFDVAVSTQLFNNRLLINGNIGNDPYASNTSNRGVIGNVDVEYKLNKSGRLRMAVFSHAADQYSNYLDDSQRSGVGVSYQQEFNKLRDIFKKKSKEQKEYDKRMKALKREERKKKQKKEKTQEKTEITAM